MKPIFMTICLDLRNSQKEICFPIPSLKLTAKAPENGWLEALFPFGSRPIFRGYGSFRECKHLIFQLFCRFSISVFLQAGASAVAAVAHSEKPQAAVRAEIEDN